MEMNMFTKASWSAVAALLVMVGTSRGDLQAILAGISDATRAGRVDRALDLANEGAALYPNSELIFFMRGQIYEHRRLFDHAIKDYTRTLAIKSAYFRAYQRRGECYFKAGLFKESIADFDKVILSDPKQEFDHWQRGISCYYAGEYSKGVRQFELRKEENPDDAENAIWHYVCNVKALGTERAGKAMFLATKDGRAWASAAHDLFRGFRKPEEVLAVSAKDETNEDLKKDNLFHAHFYIALHYETIDNAAKAREHLTIAIEKFPRRHYMYEVARVHLALIDKRTAAEKKGGPAKEGR